MPGGPTMRRGAEVKGLLGQGARLRDGGLKLGSRLLGLAEFAADY
jgi:hypothetical protein